MEERECIAIPGNLLYTEGMRRKIARVIILLLLNLIWLAGCAGRDLPDIPAEEIIQHSVERMKNMAGFSFLFERSGAPAYLDLDETLNFRRAEGVFVSPDAVSAHVRIIVPGLVVETDIVSIGSSQWSTNILTGQWEQLPPEWGFNPTVMFDPEIGIQAALASGLTELELVNTEELEEVPGLELYVIKGMMDGEAIYRTSYGLIGPGRVKVTIWIAPDTYEAHRLILTEVGMNEEDTVWRFDFWDFDQVIEISLPSLDGE